MNFRIAHSRSGIGSRRKAETLISIVARTCLATYFTPTLLV